MIPWGQAGRSRGQFLAIYVDFVSEIERGHRGRTAISDVTAGATFTNSEAKEIRTESPGNYTGVPLPMILRREGDRRTGRRGCPDAFDRHGRGHYSRNRAWAWAAPPRCTPLAEPVGLPTCLPPGPGRLGLPRRRTFTRREVCHATGVRRRDALLSR